MVCLCSHLLILLHPVQKSKFGAWAVTGYCSFNPLNGTPVDCSNPCSHFPIFPLFFWSSRSSASRWFQVFRSSLAFSGRGGNKSSPSKCQIYFSLFQAFRWWGASWIVRSEGKKKHNRLSSHQSGNKSLHSTETLNIYTTDLILEAMNKKEISALVLLDLSKAFDSICHQKLLQKLSAVGASPALVQWFRSYLSDRTQSVRIDSVLSDPLPITHGVPQGAILSPLLFCIYLNDLPGAPQFCQLESYVDDSKVLLSFPVADVIDAKFKLEDDLCNVATWCCTNDLLINPEKTKFMLIGTKQMISKHSVNFTVSFIGKTLMAVESARDLGVYIDLHLTYDTHISHLVSSCLTKLVQINRVKYCFDRKTLVLIFTSLVFT